MINFKGGYKMGVSSEGRYGRSYGGGYALILVLFILLVIIGAAWLY